MSICAGRRRVLQDAAVQGEIRSGRSPQRLRTTSDGVSDFSNHSNEPCVAIAASVPASAEFLDRSVVCLMKTSSQIVAVFASLGLIGCTTSRDSATSLAPVRQKFAAFDQHDTATIQNLYATDAVLHSPDYPDLHGNAPIAETYQRLFKAIPDARDELQSLDACGERVYAQFLLTGHWEGSPNKPIRVPILSVYTVHGGQISADSTYYDRKTP
jgi:ketosteroid isomerase-like protein